MPSSKWVIEFFMCLLMVGGPGTILVARLFIRHKWPQADGSVKEVPRGIGSRLIQLVSVLVIVPAICLLALEGGVTSELAGTLLGSVVGYTLGSLSRDKS